MTNEEKNEKNGTFLTPEGILSFPSLFEKTPVSAGSTKLDYSCKIIMAGGTDLSVFDRALAYGIANNVKAATVNTRSPKMYRALKSNTEEMDRNGDRRVGFEEDEGNNASFRQQKTKPNVVDMANKCYIIDPEQVYPGNIVRISFRPFVWVRSDGFGISYSLMNVLKLEDGERIAGAVHTDAGEDFGIKISEVDIFGQ